MYASGVPGGIPAGKKGAIMRDLGRPRAGPAAKPRGAYNARRVAKRTTVTPARAWRVLGMTSTQSS